MYTFILAFWGVGGRSQFCGKGEGSRCVNSRKASGRRASTGLAPGVNLSLDFTI